MKRASRNPGSRTAGLVLVGFLASLATAGCTSPWAGGTLVAVPVDGPPLERDWAGAVPLDLTVWMGNIHLPPEIVALDRETSHTSTADCHHGPAVSDPVKVRLTALYSAHRLYLRASWADRTKDRDLGQWRRQGSAWVAGPGSGDGIAFLWGPPDSGEIRCQQACHMVEVDVYDGGTQMRLGMRHDGSGSLDLWRWRAGSTGLFSLADDMVVDGEGKRGDEGLRLERENRRPDGPGPGIRKGDPIPYYLVSRPTGRQAQVRARDRWTGPGWQVTFSRALGTDDPDDLVFAPGGRFPFSLSVFDNTWTEHHVADKGFDLVLAIPGDRMRQGGDDPYETIDF